LLGSKDWNLCEDDTVLAGKPCGKMTLAKKAIRSLLAKCDPGGSWTFHPQDKAVPEIVAEL
jgi:hypothetical protein